MLRPGGDFSVVLLCLPPAPFWPISRRARRRRRQKPFRIDTHHHLSSPGFIAEIAGRRTGQVPLMRWTVAQSIDDMDLGGVATAILSISEPSVFLWQFLIRRASFARETNEFGAKVIADHPGRLGMFATVPLPDVEGCSARDRVRARYPEDGGRLA